MKLRATYRDGDGNRTIGRVAGSQIECEEVELETLFEAIERLHAESGFAQIEVWDGQSSVDVADSGGSHMFFIEQYYGLIYGGIYRLEETKEILTAISERQSSDALRDLFPRLDGELIYDYDPENVDKIPKMSGVPLNVRNALAPPKTTKDN